jgi:transposase
VSASPSRYPFDLTDTQWALIEPLVPAPFKDGRRPNHRRRDLVDAILYVARTGWAWRALPADFPPWQTVYRYFARWHAAAVTVAIHDALRSRVRAAKGRVAEPMAGIIDS